MKLRTKTSLLLAAALAGSSLQVASAASVSAGPSDLILGIRASGGTGQNTALLVVLGQESIFTTATVGSTFTLSLGNIAADLNSIYGTDWSTRTDLYWGVVGTREGTNPTLFATRDSTLPGWEPLPLEDRSATSGSITSVIYGTNGIRGKQSTVNSNYAVAQVGGGEAQYWNHQVAGTPLDFGAWSSVETSVGGAGDLNLYRINTNSGTFLGTFSLGSDGSLSFTVVPEPSFAVLGLAGLSLLAVRRRRATHA